MAISVQAPRGGLVEDLGGQPRTLILSNREIERFEDQRGSIFEFYDGLVGRAPKPTVKAVRDMVAFGLVGGGMADAAADALVAGLGPDANASLLTIAQALVGVAFFPAVSEDLGDDDDERPAKHVQPADAKKKPEAADGTSGA